MPLVNVSDILKAAQFTPTQRVALAEARAEEWNRTRHRPNDSDPFFVKKQDANVALWQIEEMQKSSPVEALKNDKQWRERLGASAFWQDLQQRVEQINAVVRPAMDALGKAVMTLHEMKDDLAEEAITDIARGEIQEMELPELAHPHGPILRAVAKMLASYSTSEPRQAGEADAMAVMKRYYAFLETNRATDLMPLEREAISNRAMARVLSLHGFTLRMTSGTWEIRCRAPE